MNWTATIRAALTAAGHTPDDDIVEELGHHAQALYDEQRADGVSSEDAATHVNEQIALWCAAPEALRRPVRRAPVVEPPAAMSRSWIRGLTHDVRYAGRLLRRQPGFALLAIATTALGIGATTVLFSVTYGVLLKPLPWPNGDRLVTVKETRGGMAPRFGAVTNAAFLAWSEKAATVDTLAAWSVQPMTLAGAGDPERIRAVAATALLFPALGVRPLLGSFFTPEHELADGSNTVVLSERLWRQRFGGDPAALGRVVQLDGRPHTILGVLADAFAFPDRQAQAWVPFRVRPAAGNYLSLFSAVATLRPGVTASQASAEGTGRGRFAPDTGLTTTAIFGSNGPIEITATPLREATTSDVRGPLVVLLAGVLLLLVTATANIASLQLARATTRVREMAIRAALGAGVARVTRQLLVENVLLAVVGGVTGLALATLAHRALPSLLPADFPRRDALSVDAGVALFAVAAAVSTGIICGLLPALRVRRVNLVESLGADGNGSVGAGRSGTARARMLIMTAQVAIACVLLVGASLLGRSFAGMIAADRGFDPAGVLTARLSLSVPGDTPQRRFTVVEAILDRLADSPGVEVAAFTSEHPLTPGGSTSGFTMPSRTAEGGTVKVQASPRIISPRAFAALGMRIVAGRGFTGDDTESSLPVVVVNRAFANRYLGSEPIGAVIPTAYARRGENVMSTVVGVVEDVRYVTAGNSSQPEMYYSHRQTGRALVVPTVTLLVRTTVDPRSLAPSVRLAVREADPALVAESIVPMQNRLMTTLARPRLYAVVLGSFAGVALMIAGVGLFGVLSYSVAQRSREIALRSALGATAGDIARLIVGQGMVVTTVGLAAGLFTASMLTGLMSTFLFGVTPRDPLTFFAVPILLVLMSIVACFVPARRAAKMDPVGVLRNV